MTTSLAPDDSTSAADLVESLRSALDAALRPLVPAGRPVALLDFPTHNNVGDSAIWLGGRATLRRLGAPSLCYMCDFRTFSRRELALRIGDGTIFLSGGGNFGDLYPPHQDLRHEVVSSFPDNPIVQLPQSIFFTSETALERSRRIFEKHPRITLLIRDRNSLAIARREFPGARSALCPDLALGLGPLRQTRPPSDRIVWLSRTDRESVRDDSRPPPAGVERVDWVDMRERRAPSIASRVIRRAMLQPGLMRLLDRAFAGWHLRRGVWILSGARRVITDRLHGHVLALMLGIPHCLLPSATGKIRAFYETWTRDSPLVTWCADEAEALEVALGSPTARP